MKTLPRSHITPENLGWQLHQSEESEAFFTHCPLRLHAAEQDIAQEKPLLKHAMKAAQNFHILSKQS